MLEIKSVLEYKIEEIYRELEVIDEVEKKAYKIIRIGSNIQIFYKKDSKLYKLSDYDKKEFISSIKGHSKIKDYIFERDDDLCEEYCKRLLS